MIAPAKVPQFLLFADATDGRDSFDDDPCGKWCFLLESLDGEEVVEASDYEAKVGRERLELLAVVRGLEALDQPSRVMLVTPSRYVNRGIRFGLDSWRESDWKWERFGLLSPIKNDDLWKRVDAAMQIHQVECRRWKLDRESDSATETLDSNSQTLPAAAEETARLQGDGAVVNTMRDMAAVAG